MKSLNSKENEIKLTITNLNDRIKSFTEPFNSNINENGKEKSKYTSLSFIQDECEKCSKDINEALLKIFETSLGWQIEHLIHVLDNENKGIKLDEESKLNSYKMVPDEIYEKTFKMIDISLQSGFLLEEFRENIKKTFEYAEINQKVMLNR